MHGISPREWLITFLQLYILGSFLWAAANSCIKASILFLYIGLFPNKIFTRLCYGTMLAIALFLILVLVKDFGLCRPVQYNWDKTIDGVCTGQSPMNLMIRIVNCVIDACILVLPLPLVFRLRMTLTRRMSVAGMFSLGALYVHPKTHMIIGRITDGSMSSLEFVLFPFSGLSGCIRGIRAIWPTTVLLVVS